MLLAFHSLPPLGPGSMLSRIYRDPRQIALVFAFGTPPVYLCGGFSYF